MTFIAEKKIVIQTITVMVGMIVFKIGCDIFLVILGTRLVIGEDEVGDKDDDGMMMMRTKMMTTLFIMSEKLTVHSS